MPKAFLKYDLEDPYERESFETAVKADKYKIFSEEIYQAVFRPIVKQGFYKNREATEQEVELADYLLEKINELRKDCGLE